jgi:hypothetical protein
VISERTWTIDYAGRTDVAALPTTFHFPQAKIEPAEISYMRYEDADLKTVEPTVSLVHEYGEVRRLWPWALAIGSFLLAALAIAIYSFVHRRPEEDVARWALPETLTPFNVLALLRGIERNNGFDPRTREDLNSTIASIEHYYFADNGKTNGDSPDLRGVAETWLARRG